MLLLLIFSEFNGNKNRCNYRNELKCKVKKQPTIFELWTACALNDRKVKKSLHTRKWRVEKEKRRIRWMDGIMQMIGVCCTTHTILVQSCKFRSIPTTIISLCRKSVDDFVVGCIHCVCNIFAFFDSMMIVLLVVIVGWDMRQKSPTT